MKLEEFNFDLPEELLLHAYGEAIKEKYRFYSYGDAMLIV
jgi:S-adenosylmethionine:tRNA-ribosyltransferase-isomerase (queuine synthetase)